MSQALLRAALIAELGLSVVAGLVFLGLFVGRHVRRPLRRADPVMFWHIAAFSGAALVADGVLFLLAVGVKLPAWVFLFAYGVQAVVVVQRLWLLLWARHDR